MLKFILRARLVLASILFCLFTVSVAQDICSQTHMLPVYSTFDTVRNIVYGKNIDVNGDSDTLFFDFYQAKRDTSHKRPLLILAHGGSFVSGVKTEPAIVRLCHEFASRGYATASITYRLSNADAVYSGAELQKANYRAVQDLKAAIRFFRSRADSFHIDTALIFCGGTSAGAFIAIQAAYMDQNEIMANVDTTQLGSLEGSSGSPGYSSHFRGVINCWGAIGDTAWLAAGNLPIVSIHESSDPIVPSNAGWVFNIPGIFKVYGSISINQRAIGQSVFSRIKVFPGASHGIAVTVPQFDTAVSVINSFLGAIINCDSGKVASKIQLSSRSLIEHPASWIRTGKHNTLILQNNTAISQISFFDCFGKQIDLHPIALAQKSTVSILVPATGIYFAVDTRDNKNKPAVLELYR